MQCESIEPSCSASQSPIFLDLFGDMCLAYISAHRNAVVSYAEYRMNEAHRQLKKAGLLNYLAWIEADEDSIEAWAAAALIPDLRKHPSFVETPWWWLHRTLGKHLTDFRGLRGTFGEGSLQIVVDKKTGRCYADVDTFAPIDVVGMIMHMRDVIRDRFKKGRTV